MTETLSHNMEVHVLNSSAVQTYSNFLHQISSLVNLSLLLFDFSKSFDQSCSLYLNINLQMNNCQITHIKTMNLKRNKKSSRWKILTLPAETLLSVLISSMRVSMSGVKSMYSIALWTIAVMACDKQKWQQYKCIVNKTVASDIHD